MGNKKQMIIVAIVLGIVAISVVVILTRSPLDGDLDKQDQTANSNNKPLVGFCIDTMVIERWQKDVDRFTSNAESKGYEVKVANAYEDPDRQIQQIRDLVDAGAVAIMIIPFEKDALKDIIDEARKQGVVVISYDRLITNAEVDAYVSFDNVKVGDYMASYLLEAAPTGNYIIINGSPDDNNSTMFNEGYYKALQPAIDAGEITIVSEVWADKWREDVAREAVTAQLEAGVEISAIIGANDRLAEAAIDVLAEYGLAGTIPVVGHDADVSACQRIIAGKQLMTVYKPITNLAEGAVEVMEQALKGQEIIGDDYLGEYDVPYVKFEVVPVNADNMRETVIADHFHSEEDVYRGE